MKRSKFKKSLFAGILIAVLMLAAAGCNGEETNTTANPGSTLSGTFSIVGSNTVTPISTIWAEQFMADNPKVNISVSGPGSGAGIAALINGTTDVCQSSRLIKQEEIEQAHNAGVEPYEIQVASDALSVVVNPDNPVDELTIAQLSAIYTGRITNWKEVGGNDASIVVLARDTNSGTHVYFKEEVVQMAGLPTADKTLVPKRNSYGGVVAKAGKPSFNKRKIIPSRITMVIIPATKIIISINFSPGRHRRRSVA